MIRWITCLGLLWVASSAPLVAQGPAGTLEDGFFPLRWDEAAGKLWLEVRRPGEDFLYVTSLATGLGSNPLGLDRSRLGESRVVRFERVGAKVLLHQRNLKYRALSQDAAEVRAVEESFASSVLWGGTAAENAGRLEVDVTSLLLQDTEGVASALKGRNQGEFRLDPTRSVIYRPRCRAFPDNTELEAVLTFVGDNPGSEVSSTAASGNAFTLRQHHSFVRLPDAEYRPRVHDPRCGMMFVEFADYAAPIDQPLHRRWVRRHRLQKRVPGTAPSEPKKPLVYYLDRGAPEPLRSALLEGAGFWTQAFEEAGFLGGFSVELLPEGADPMDVRYNVIQWVHRATRGWSYGSSVVDPRTGEILKGHVLLGSLRVRQDRMLVEGFTPAFAEGAEGIHACNAGSLPGAEGLAWADPKTTPQEVALARIRQLAAHEVGHTLGFVHNFAASANDRASVMDYPAPRVAIDGEKLDLSRAYAVGVGAWDKVTVGYGYREFASAEEERAGLEEILQAASRAGLQFITDADARPRGAAHPFASLWDDGDHPTTALKHSLRVRSIALRSFGPGNLPKGRPLAELEEVLVPVYLHHRFQVLAAAKLLGGQRYTYAVRGDRQVPIVPIPPREQWDALEALLSGLELPELELSTELLATLVPSPPGRAPHAERFAGRTGATFDAVSAAVTAAELVLNALLQPERAARLVAQYSQTASAPGFHDVLDRLIERTWRNESAGRSQLAIQRGVQRAVVDAIMALARDESAASDVRALALDRLRTLGESLSGRKGDAIEDAHRRLVADDILRFINRAYPDVPPVKTLPAPPGDPIGH